MSEKVIITYEVSKCRECPHLKIEKDIRLKHPLTYNLICSSINRPVMMAVEYPNQEPTQIPTWCPFKIIKEIL